MMPSNRFLGTSQMMKSKWMLNWGTEIIGVGLSKLGCTQEMLDEAKKNNVLNYQRIPEIETGEFDALVGFGTLAQGHVYSNAFVGRMVRSWHIFSVHINLDIKCKRKWGRDEPNPLLSVSYFITSALASIHPVCARLTLLKDWRSLGAKDGISLETVVLRRWALWQVNLVLSTELTVRIGHRKKIRNLFTVHGQIASGYQPLQLIRPKIILV